MVASCESDAEALITRLVSIPFIAGQWSLPAVAAWRAEERAQVSIPFIAGQWSLPAAGHERRRRTAACFNPLHCGAVVASQDQDQDRDQDRKVSIPFIAGQWSLPEHPPSRPTRRPRVSIPFIAGQWSLLDHFHDLLLAPPCFNPLHCGAVVASPRDTLWSVIALPVSIPFIAGQWSLLSATRNQVVEVYKFQSPSLRGSGRFRGNGADGAPQPGRVSIPFIAGQWSLRSSTRPPTRSRSCFNPLHCGAVVASRVGGIGSACRRRVSIPFIAGQWSLPADPPPPAQESPSFQSPSLRGSGRFARRSAVAAARPVSFNPLHCGAVVASASQRAAPERRLLCFNPLHCGAVVASDRPSSIK